MFNRRNFLNTLLTSSLVTPRGWVQANPAPASAVPSWPDENDPAFWDQVRDQFYIAPGEAYFNTATLGATPRPVLERVIEDMRTVETTITRWDYTPKTEDLISGYMPALSVREKLGKLVNAAARDLALTQNSTMGMNFIAQGLNLKAGDEVILTDHEHPGGICGWQERARKDGIVVKQVRIPTPANDPERLVGLFAEAMTPRTRVLAFAHILFSSGVVMPVKQLTQLAHERGCLCVIDGAQAVGQVKVNLQDLGCDAYFSSPHKWLLAPPGNGMLYIRPDQQTRFWTTLCSQTWDDEKDGMFRFMQYGTGNRSLLVGLEAALDFHFKLGSDRVLQRIHSLADRLRAGLQKISGARISSPIHPKLAGAVVVHRVEGVSAGRLEQELWMQKKIRVRSQGDQLGVRQSCQIYNNEAEIDATLEIVRKLSASG
jgi:isopenicillin-N epimerase